MKASEDGRPSKKARTEGPEKAVATNVSSKSKQMPKWQGQKVAYKRQQRRADLDHPQPESRQHRLDRELFGIDEDLDEETSLKPLQNEEREKLRKLHAPKMFSQPSVMSTGDKGIFVTCDKGREKKCLTELADLVEEYLEKHKLIPAELVDPDALLQDRLERQQKRSATIHVDNEESPEEDEEADIEASVNAELASMKSPHPIPGTHPAKDAPFNVRAFQLITLDVPCVSFLRFVPGSIVFEKVDVVDVVHSICAEAAGNPGRGKSRFIKRLSPVTWLGKVLSDGLEKACDEVLPTHFKIDGAGDANKEVAEDHDEPETATFSGIKFAVKPTIRNNKKVSRDDMIKKIAEEVQKLGGGKHKVDLKGYEKGIMLEVYRGWVGLSVVDNTSSTGKSGDEAKKNGYGYGYETLKRFNLAEIYAEGLNQGTVKSPQQPGLVEGDEKP